MGRISANPFFLLGLYFLLFLLLVIRGETGKESKVRYFSFLLPGKEPLYQS